MSSLDDVVRRRRMTRSFRSEAVAPTLVDELVDLASRAPSAGKAQGWHLVVLEGADTERFWSNAFPTDRRSGFRWPGLFAAPVIALPFADPQAYVERYAEHDKAATGLGAGTEAWPTPYWTVDASMAVMTLLYAAEDRGLGALFFAVFHGAEGVRTELGVPAHLQLLGAIALGWPADGDSAPGASARRPRRSPPAIIHRGRW